MKKQYLFIIIIVMYVPIQLCADILTDLHGMRKNYESWSNGKPFGDINRGFIGNREKSQRLIFSESVSYVLFSLVLPIEGEDEIQMKTRFDSIWAWAKNNLVRSQDRLVYSWDYENNENYQKWIPLPGHLHDNLMAWRWVELIENTEQSGIIYQTEDETKHLFTPGIFQDGSQVATDGDLLTAYSLLLAYDRWHDEKYLIDAKKIIICLRKKAVINFKAGELLNIEKQNQVNNLFKGIFNDNHASGIIEGPTVSYNKVLSWSGMNNYVGIWYDPLLDLSEMDEIILTVCGHTNGNVGVYLEIEDKIDNNETGHIYITREPLSLKEDLSVISLKKEDFVQKKSYGVQAPIDWSKIKNISLNTKVKYYTFSGNSIELNDNFPHVFQWSGNKCYFGFDFINSKDFSELSNIEMNISGDGNITLQIFMENDDNPFNYSFTLNSKNEELIITPENFSENINWYLIQKINLNANGYIDANLKILKFNFNDGSSFIIEPQPINSFSQINLQSIEIKLKSGQTQENNGFHLISNAHGAPYLNPSYFMPFAYKKFISVDSDGAEIWKGLLDRTYIDLQNSLNVLLHDLKKQSIENNGYLFPDWFQLDPLTGKFTDVAIQKPNNTVRGYEFGYDAFRSIAFLAIDYYLDKNNEAYELLKTIYPFFANSLNYNDIIYPVYKIDGTPVIPANFEFTGFGFYAVYLNLFNIMSDQRSIDKILYMYKNSYRQTNGEHVWVKSNEPGFENGKTEYYMNFWSFLGLYFFNNFYSGPDINYSSEIDFGSLMKNTTIQLPVVINNPEESNVTIGELSEPLNSKIYQIVNNQCTNKTLNINDSCIIDVEFFPKECGFFCDKINFEYFHETASKKLSVDLKGSALDWGHPEGKLIGTPNWGYSLLPLYDKSIDTDHLTELDEVPANGDINTCFGIIFDSPKDIRGIRFYSYPQSDGVNHIKKYKVMARIAGNNSNQWVYLTQVKNAYPGCWNETVFEQPKSVYGIKILYTQTSYYSPKVGEMEFLSSCLSKQSIQFKEGWNIISFKNRPDNMNIQDLFFPLIDTGHLIKVIDEKGNDLQNIMGNWLNRIGNANLSSAYHVKVKQDSELRINGKPSYCELYNSITLQKGWNLIGWPYEKNGDAKKILQSLIDKELLIKAYDESGDTIIKLTFKNPDISFWHYGFDTFEPGKGYMIKTSDSFVVPISFIKENSNSRSKKISKNVNKNELHFQPIWDNNPYNRMNIWLKSIDNFDIEIGDEIGVFDGELCVGVKRIENPPSLDQLITITCSANDGDNNGFRSGNKISFRLWDQDKQKEISNQFIEPSFYNILNLEKEDNYLFIAFEDVLVSLNIKTTIHATAENGGSIEPSGLINLSFYSNQTFEIKPDPGYQLEYLLIDQVKKQISNNNTYSFQNIQKNYTITAHFSNESPEIQSIDVQNIEVNSKISKVYIQIKDRETPPENMNITINSSNTSLVSNKDILFSKVEGTLSITPQKNKFGSSLITITATDEAGFSTSSTFKVNVNLVTQEIHLKKGWNMISTYLQPVNQTFEDILKPLIKNDLKKVIGPDQTILVVNNKWQYGIEYIDYHDGYLINVSNDSVLPITGIPASLPVTINLLPGWNLIGFPCANNMNIDSIIKPLKDSNQYIKMISNDQTNIKDLNEIKNFEPGKAYWIKISEGPINKIIITGSFNNDLKKRSQLSVNEDYLVNKIYSKTDYKSIWTGNPFQRMNIWFTGEYGLNLKAGDIIAVFDKKSCVGSKSVPYDISIPLKITTSMDDKINKNVKNGFTIDNEIIIKIWNAEKNSEIQSFYPVFSKIEDSSIILKPLFKDREDYSLKLIHPVKYVTYSLQSLVDINHVKVPFSIFQNRRIEIKDIIFGFGN